MIEIQFDYLAIDNRLQNTQVYNKTLINFIETFF